MASIKLESKLKSPFKGLKLIFDRYESNKDLNLMAIHVPIKLVSNVLCAN